ncbi:MAG: hypothetical protein ICV64_10120 [Thermoleophilia bacterium]|nr:hypothetical protein [Thermoleophilia bacterium]
MRERTIVQAALALIAGGFVWAVAWFLLGFTEDGARPVLGLSEGAWRAVLNPALLAVMAGAWIFFMRLGSRAGGLGFLAAVVVEAGLLATLIGNVVEVGLWGDGFSETGWDVFVAGTLGTLLGVLLLGVAIVRTGLLPRAVSLPFAGGLAAFLAGAMLGPAVGIGWLLWGYVLLGARGVTPDEE